MRPFAFKSVRFSIRRLGQAAALVVIASGCYTPIRTDFPDGDVGGSGGGGTGGTTGTDGGSDALDDAVTDADGPTCANGSKLCDGRCIPVAACCGPCSCEGLPRTCGPNRNEDCCTSVLVTGGTFNRDNNTNYPATVSDFHLDRFEVTVGRFQRFVAGGEGLASAAPAMRPCWHLPVR